MNQNKELSSVFSLLFLLLLLNLTAWSLGRDLTKECMANSFDNLKFSKISTIGSKSNFKGEKNTDFFYSLFFASQCDYGDPVFNKTFKYNTELNDGVYSYAKGFSLHSDCSMHFKLNSNIKEFSGKVHLAKEVLEAGNKVLIQILNNGLVIWEDELNKNKTLKYFNLPVIPSSFLTLKVLSSDDGIINDIVNWVELRLE